MKKSDSTQRAFSKWMEEHLEKSNLTPIQLAEKLGVQKAAISNYKNGHRIPLKPLLRKLEQIFGDTFNPPPVEVSNSTEEELPNMFISTVVISALAKVACPITVHRLVRLLQAEKVAKVNFPEQVWIYMLMNSRE